MGPVYWYRISVLFYISSMYYGIYHDMVHLCYSPSTGDVGVTIMNTPNK